MLYLQHPTLITLKEKNKIQRSHPPQTFPMELRILHNLFKEQR
jgi:hypothetical protein